jgi:hypothetical protein
VSSLNTGSTDHDVTVGDGYTDVTPRQIVRSLANRLYIATWKFDTYPHGGIGGGNYNAQTLRMYRSDQDGLPASFTRMDSAHEPAGVTNWSIAIDQNDVIHVVWMVRATWSSGSGTDNYVRYCTFDTTTGLWGSVTDIETAAATQEMGQGDELCSIAIDTANVPHIVYLKHDGTRRRVTYRNRSGGSWSAATTVDDQTFSAGFQCWHPGIAFDDAGRIVVTWMRGASDYTTTGTYFIRVYSGGSWGTTHTVQGSVWTGIDTGTPIYIDAAGRYHTCFLSASKYVQYRYSDNQGTTWSTNNPGSGSYAGDDPTPGPGPGGTVRIYVHSDDPTPNIVYFEGAGGSGAWDSAVDYTTATPTDCSVNVRWAQYWYRHPGTRDIAYWKNYYPTNALFVGTDIDAIDKYGSDSATLTDSGTTNLPVAGTDSGTLTDASAIEATPAARTDSGTLSELASVIAATARAGTDSGTVMDATATMARTVTDNATLTDATTALTANPSATDSGTLSSETSTLDITEFLTITGSDSATLAEAADTPVVDVTISEAIAFSEAGALEVAIDATDVIALDDTSLLNTGEAPLSVDSGSLSETSVLAVVCSSTDVFTLGEGAISITAVLGTSDSFHLSDATAAIAIGGVTRDSIAFGLTIDQVHGFGLTIDQQRSINLEF